ncbi:MAG: hypothetical protein ACLPXB_04065 [Thiobacillaceae bacterium]
MEGWLSDVVHGAIAKMKQASLFRTVLAAEAVPLGAVVLIEDMVGEIERLNGMHGGANN